MNDTVNSKPPKGFYKTTILIGLGFFTMGLMDPLYDAFVPLFLADFISSRFIIGMIMTLDNVFALFLIPIAAGFSDRTHTSIGRRMPYIIVLLPISALLFGILPYGALPTGSLTLLIAAVFFFNFIKQPARGPVVALMPDLTPDSFRSEANGVINFMGGVAAIVGTVLLGPLMDVNINLPIIGSTLRKLPFLLSAILVILATLLLFLFVKEPSSPLSKEEEEKRPKIIDSLKHIFGVNSPAETSGRYILLALFFWFLGYQGMLPFVTTYSRDLLGTTEGLASLSPGAVAIAYALFAIPSGILGHKIGRKKVISFSLVGIIAVLGLIFLHNPVAAILGLSTFSKWISFLVLLFFFGMFWGTIITNSFPMLWNMAAYQTMGIYTGMYYVFSQGAAITAPMLSGGVIDITAGIAGEELGLRSIFLFAVLCMGVALYFIGKVKEPAKNQNGNND